MRITINPTTYAEWWTGSRTINIYTLEQYVGNDAAVRAWGPRWANTDCISFGYDKPDNSTTQIEMLAVLLRHLDDVYSVDTIELSLCADCIYMDANGTLPDDADPDAAPLTKLDGWLISPNETDHICEGHFGYGCDGCDTRLGGTRYCYVGVQR